MGNVNMCKEAPLEEEITKVKNQTISGKSGILDLPSDCRVRVCVVAYDYHGYGADPVHLPRLSAVRDGVRFAKMAKDSGAAVTEYYDRTDLNKEGKLSAGFPTKQVILDKLRSIGSEIGRNEVFVFYFAGHGRSQPREIEEGHDEMMICMEPDGTPSYLKDDEVASVLVDAFPEHAHVLLITDCFHNGTLCDLSRPTLAGRPILHVAAVKDNRHLPIVPKGKEPMKDQESRFTRTILETVEQLVAVPMTGEHMGSTDISVVDVYNKVFTDCNAPLDAELQDEALVQQREKQDFFFERTSKFDPDTFRWPLMPMPGWLINDPLDTKPATGLGMFACMG